MNKENSFFFCNILNTKLGSPLGGTWPSFNRSSICLFRKVTWLISWQLMVTWEPAPPMTFQLRTTCVNFNFNRLAYWHVNCIKLVDRSLMKSLGFVKTRRCHRTRIVRGRQRHLLTSLSIRRCKRYPNVTLTWLKQLTGLPWMNWPTDANLVVHLLRPSWSGRSSR